MEGEGGLRARLSEVRAAMSQGAAFRKDEVLAGLFAKGNMGWLGRTASTASMAAVLIAAFR